jgi:hypothetical protein
MSFVRYAYLEKDGIMSNRVQLSRSIERYGFPMPLALGSNTLAWNLEEVEAWVASRPRRAPKSGAKKASTEVMEELDSVA